MKENKVRLELELLISEAQKDLKALGDGMNKTWKNGEPPKSYQKSLKEFQARLLSLSKLTENGLISGKGITEATGEYKGFVKEIKEVILNLELMSKADKLNMTGQLEMYKKSTAALKAYQDLLARNSTKKEEFDTTNAALIKAKKERGNASSSAKAVRSSMEEIKKPEKSKRIL